MSGMAYADGLRTLSPGMVQVWLVRLNLIAECAARLDELLDDSERARARRFVFERHRQHYVAAHAFTRAVLAQYANTRPEILRFTSDTYGKPVLLGADGLKFNLTHSSGVGALAVANAAEVGIDVECERPDVATRDLARRFFAPSEVAALDRYAGPHYTSAFFACWTRKEAYVKAVGLGLSLELDSFVVSVDPDAPPELLHTGTGDQERLRWALYGFRVAADCHGTVVVERAATEPPVYQWSDLSELLN
jgi:4'-phosphopantetheinyl transferase